MSVNCVFTNFALDYRMSTTLPLPTIDEIFGFAQQSQEKKKISVKIQQHFEMIQDLKDLRLTNKNWRKEYADKQKRREEYAKRLFKHF